MSITIYLLVLIELLFVSYGDIKTKRIPHIWNLLNIIFYVAALFLLSDIYQFSFSALFYSIAFFLVGFLLFALNIMGGGDSKFLATLFLLIPIKYQEDYFTCLLYVTIVVGSLLLLINTIKNFNRVKQIIFMRDYQRLKEVYGKKFTYAPVMFVSWLVFGYIIKIWSL